MLLDAEILSEKLHVYFDDLMSKTLIYIDIYARERERQQLYFEPSARPILYNFSEDNVNGDWDLAINKEKVIASKFIILILNHLKALFLNKDSRDTLLHVWLNISSGSIPAYVLIHQAHTEDEKIPLSINFKALDPLTQLYIVFQLRQVVDQIIKGFPLADSDVSPELISSEMKEEWMATTAFLKKHESFRSQVYDKLEKFIQQNLPALKRPITSSQKEIDRMLELVTFYYANSPSGTLYPVVSTPSMSLESGVSTPMQILKLKDTSLLVNAFHSIPIRSQLEMPYTVSDQLVADIAQCFGNLSVKYTSLRKDSNSISDLKTIQQYFVLKAIHEEILSNSGSVSPKRIEEAFKNPELVFIRGQNKTITKSFVFDKGWSFFESNMEGIYRRLKEEIKVELWSRVKTFDFVYDLIIDDFSNELEKRLTKEYNRLIQTSPWFIKVGKFDVNTLSKTEVVQLHKRMAIEIIYRAFENSRLSVSLLEEVVQKFPDYSNKIFSFFTSEIQRIVEAFKTEMGEILWKIASEGFSKLNEYKAPEVTPKWSRVSLSH